MAYSTSKKAAVLIDLASDMSVAAVTRKHGVARNTVLKWQSEIETAAGSKLNSSEIVSDRSDVIASPEQELLEAVQHTVIQRVKAPGRILAIISTESFVISNPAYVAAILECAAETADGALAIASKLAEQGAIRTLPG